MITPYQLAFGLVFAFATGVLIWDIAQDPPMPAASRPITIITWTPPAEVTAKLCAHAMATGRGWRCM